MASVKKIKSTTRKRVVRARKKAVPLLDASALGVVPEQLAFAQGVKPQLISFASMPPPNLPIEPIDEIKPQMSILHRPLVSGRTSFWLGVGLGMFIVGVLTALAWKLLTVEAVQALW